MSFDVRHVRFRVRGRPAAEWVSLNEILLEREFGLETDTGRFKFGDGVTPWNDLPYAVATLAGFAMRVEGGMVQYTVDGSTWEDLVDTSELAGPAGADGAPGTPGTPGAPGKSAYEVAVDNGFVGTEEDWLESLAGEEGPEGPEGPAGPAGGPSIVMTTSGNITLDGSTHKGRYLRHTAGAITLDKPSASGFATNDVVEVRRQSGTVTFDATGGAVLDYNSALYSLAINALKDVVALKVVDGDTWDVIGPLADAP